MSNNYAIITHNIVKYYGNIRAIGNINLKVPYGKIFGLIGPNGAGKTTLIRILNCIYEPDKGTAIVSGYDVIKNKKKVKMNCGLLPQTPGLYNKLTAREFLEFVGELYYLSKKVIYSRIDKFLKIFNLKERENDLLESYSRGMKQKISLLAALIHDPQIVFLDEPTSNLDPATARFVKDLISMFSKTQGKTFFLSTNLLNVAEELCDIIGIIDKGVIKAIGTPESIIKSASANNLEEVYLNITGKAQSIDLLEWNKREI